MKQLFFVGLCTLCAASSQGQNLVSAEFEAIPAFTETFAGGTPVGQWELAPGNLAGAVPATYSSTTPAGVSPTVTALNPVATAEDNGVMVQGNPSSTNGSLFGLNYMWCINSAANGSGTDFSTLNKYRVVARMYLYTPAQQPERWQIGPFGFNGTDLFRPASFYNTTSLGSGPGFGMRGSTEANTVLIPNTSAITESGWTDLSLMLDASDADPLNHRIAICVDANRDGMLNESDPLEYLPHTLNSTKYTPGPFGSFTVGNVNSDGFPLFVDTVELYLPITSSVQDWTIY